MNSFDDQDFLENNFVPLKDELTDQNLALFQNNASSRKSNDFRLFICKQHRIKNPDINSIKNFWEILIGQVKGNRKQMVCFLLIKNIHS